MDELHHWRKMKDYLPKELKSIYLMNGKLSTEGLKSEYERGFVDCWNKLIYHCS